MKEPPQLKGLKKDLKPLGLYYQIHLTKGSKSFQKSISLIVQGRNESTQMYEHLIPTFTEKNNKDLFLFDLRGQGQSKGVRAHIDSFQDYIKDLEVIVLALRKIYQTVHLITHSTGGLIATLFSTLNQEKLGKGGTLSLISPFLGLKSTGIQQFLVNKKLLTVSQTYDALFRFFPKLKLRRFEFSKTDNFKESSLTTDPTFFKDFNEHPSKCGPPTWWWLNQCFKAQMSLKTVTMAIKIPVFIVVAKKDTVVENKAAWHFYLRGKRANRPWKLKEFRGMKHALFQAPPLTRERLMDDLIKFQDNPKRFLTSR